MDYSVRYKRASITDDLITMSLSTEFSLRPYRVTDAPQVVELINAEARQALGIQRARLDGVGNVRLMRYVPASSQKVVAINSQQQIIGYAYVVNRDQWVIYEMGGTVHPDYWDRGVGTRLLNWSEQQAQALSNTAPPGIRTVLQANLFEAEARARHLFGRAGYTQAREWLHLQLELNGPPSKAVLPDGMSLREIDLDKDWNVLGPAMDEAYADHWGVITAPLPEPPASSPEPSLPEDQSYSNAPGFCFAALAGGEVAGGILCNAKVVEQTGTGRVGSLFVRPAFRRQGVGRALMLAAFEAFWRAGIRRIILDTDAQSFTQAPKFYAQLGMQVYRREYLYEKELRPGREVRRLETR